MKGFQFYFNYGLNDQWMKEVELHNGECIEKIRSEHEIIEVPIGTKFIRFHQAKC